MSYQDREWLEEQYHAKGLTQGEIAEKCSVSRNTIIRWMKRHGVESRGPGCSQAKGRYKDEDWLREKYWDERMSLEEIGDECSVSGETVRHWVDKFGIETREPSEAISLSWEGDDERREWAAKNVQENARPEAPQIKHGEHRPETIEKMSEAKVGEKNPVWVGGYEGEYGHTWSRMREKALERDEYECQVCGAEEQLHVHHKLPVRTFEDPNDAHYMVNLVTCCVSCHPKLDRISRRHTFVW
jgi:5-methylcytosine-specific restriction endonuclease McrA